MFRKSLLGVLEDGKSPLPLEGMDDQDHIQGLEEGIKLVLDESRKCGELKPGSCL